MRGLDNMKARLNYQGGNAEGRFQKDKLNSLRKALLYSYQAETITLSDGRQFRALINSNKLNGDYDEKVISIPYEDICLNGKKFNKTSQGKEIIGMACGDTFYWDRTNTYWLVYLEQLSEDSYFRGQIRKCNTVVKLNDTEYHCYKRGPAEMGLAWNKMGNGYIGEMNYSEVLFITKTEETLDFFKRYTKIDIDGEMWEISAVNRSYGDGIIRVVLKEKNNNSLEHYENKTAAAQPKETPTQDAAIQGQDYVFPYDIVNFTIVNVANPAGTWEVDNKKVKIIKATADSLTLEVCTMKSGRFNIKYVDGDFTLTHSVIIQSM